LHFNFNIGNSKNYHDKLAIPRDTTKPKAIKKKAAPLPIAWFFTSRLARK
jgi:hypothetical protein